MRAESPTRQSSPGPTAFDAHGEVRDNYVNVCDITPTIYDLLDITPPDEVSRYRRRSRWTG